MNASCPLPSPAERQYGEILSRAQDAMMQKIYAALDSATQDVGDEIAAANLDMPPPASDYFAAVVHQRIYCLLCKADPETFAGGRPDIAASIIRNCQNIARYHWGAKPDPSSPT